VEFSIGILLINRPGVSLSIEEESSLVNLLKKKQELLANEEVKWHLRSRVMWIQEGDNNIIFFHNYANYRKVINTINDICDEDGCKNYSFEEIVEARKVYYSNILKSLPGFPIREILQVIPLFPKVFNQEQNLSLAEEITKKIKFHDFVLFSKRKTLGSKRVDSRILPRVL
jgi:hypothetical protein